MVIIIELTRLVNWSSSVENVWPEELLAMWTQSQASLRFLVNTPLTLSDPLRNLK